jgi:hypothetical protein
VFFDLPWGKTKYPGFADVVKILVVNFLCLFDVQQGVSTLNPKCPPTFMHYDGDCKSLCSEPREDVAPVLQEQCIRRQWVYQPGGLLRVFGSLVFWISSSNCGSSNQHSTLIINTWALVVSSATWSGSEVCAGVTILLILLGLWIKRLNYGG